MKALRFQTGGETSDIPGLLWGGEREEGCRGGGRQGRENHLFGNWTKAFIPKHGGTSKVIATDLIKANVRYGGTNK